MALTREYNVIVIGREFDLSEYINACVAHRSGAVLELTNRADDDNDNDNDGIPATVVDRTIKIRLLYPESHSVIVKFYHVRGCTDWCDVDITRNIDMILIHYGVNELYSSDAYNTRRNWVDAVANTHASLPPKSLFISCDTNPTLIDGSPNLEDIITNVIGEPMTLISTIMKMLKTAPTSAPVLYVPRSDALRHLTIGIATFNVEERITFEHIVLKMIPRSNKYKHKVWTASREGSDEEDMVQYVVNTSKGNTMLTFVHHDWNGVQAFSYDVLVVGTHHHQLTSDKFHRCMREMDVMNTSIIIGLENDETHPCEYTGTNEACELQCTVPVSPALSRYRAHHFGYVHAIVPLIGSAYVPSMLNAIFNIYMPYEHDVGKLHSFIY